MQDKNLAGLQETSLSPSPFFRPLYRDCGDTSKGSSLRARVVYREFVNSGHRTDEETFREESHHLGDEYLEDLQELTTKVIGEKQ